MSDREVMKLALEALDTLVSPEGSIYAQARKALRARLAAPKPRITCGFVDVRFDGERWFCEMCGDRMSDRYEEMVKHSNGKDYLELMQRKAAFKIGRNMK